MNVVRKFTNKIMNKPNKCAKGMKNQIAIELLKVTLDKRLPSVAADAIVVQVIKLLEKCGTSNPGYDGNAQCQKGGLHQWVDKEPQKADEFWSKSLVNSNIKMPDGCDCCGWDDHGYQHEPNCSSLNKADERPWEDESESSFPRSSTIRLSTMKDVASMPEVEKFIQKTVSESLRRAAERVRAMKVEENLEGNDYASGFQDGFNDAVDEAAEATINSDSFLRDNGFDGLADAIENFSKK